MAGFTVVTCPRCLNRFNLKNSYTGRAANKDNLKIELK